MSSTQVTFEFEEMEAERRFLRRYMVPAWDRFEEMDAFESGWFWRHGRVHRHGIDGLEEGKIIFVINGTPGAVIERERDRWEAQKAEGELAGWSTRTFRPEYEDSLDKLRQNFGEVGGRRNYRLRTLAPRFTLEMLREFEDPLPAVGEATDDNPLPVNFWVLFHYLMKQSGYDWYDEIDAATKAIENRLRSLAEFRGEAEARRQLRETIEELEAFSEELDTPSGKRESR
ncbi:MULTISPECIES: hypothetical protein [Halorussus]|uniref:hypothetical protein n=1 Tax=Halorussus TaxID=1070314 RepID=UPI0020A0DF5C|nr:hypothetical protein [Halorussus vallis]USZ76078.1 hypothetical protein NGM07_01845 [Halorussus vallis]